MKMMAIKNDIELLDAQTYKNIAVIPLKTRKTYLDILTLKKGLELELVKVKECETSTVNTLIVENHSVTPLILIDGEEVVGGDQNRIVNATILIDSKSEKKIPVSCTEKGRWAYKSEFKQSNYIANYNTRRAKEYASRSNSSYQDAVWSSIDSLQVENEFYSATSAMEESYENLKSNHEKIIREFEIIHGQTGILIMIDGEVKGFELFLNPEIYRDFHEKILKSYLIDAKLNDDLFTVNRNTAEEIIANAFEASFDEKQSNGIEDAFEFENADGLGTIYTYKNQIIHLSYFTKMVDNYDDGINDGIGLETDI